MEEVAHVLVALVGLVAVAAAVLATMSWQRSARLQRRVEHLEAEVGRHPEEASEPVVERHQRETLRGRVRALEVGRVVTDGLVTRLQKKLAPRRPAAPPASGR